VISYPRSDAEDAISQDCGIHDVIGNESSRMWNRGGRAPLEVNRPITFVDGNTLPGALPSPRIMDFQRPVDGVVLGWKGVPIDNRPLDLTDLPCEFEPA
jgi:hypothetical protein